MQEIIIGRELLKVFLSDLLKKNLSIPQIKYFVQIGLPTKANGIYDKSKVENWVIDNIDRIELYLSRFAKDKSIQKLGIRRKQYPIGMSNKILNIIGKIISDGTDRFFVDDIAPLLFDDEKDYIRKRAMVRYYLDTMASKGTLIKTKLGDRIIFSGSALLFNELKLMEKERLPMSNENKLNNKEEPPTIYPIAEKELNSEEEKPAISGSLEEAAIKSSHRKRRFRSFYCEVCPDDEVLHYKKLDKVQFRYCHKCNSRYYLLNDEIFRTGNPIEPFTMIVE